MSSPEDVFYTVYRDVIFERKTPDECASENIRFRRVEDPKEEYSRTNEKFGELELRYRLTGEISKPDPQLSVIDNGEDEIVVIFENLRKTVDSLRLKGIALGAIHEFIDRQEPLSPLIITEDLRLFLPLYNNIEIKLGAQHKALFFLFLNHPEGIVLQHLAEYHNEWMNYYCQTNKRLFVSRSKMEESLRKLETYGNNQLNVVLTRIREAFCKKFDERLACNYFIRGEKGQAYKITLNRDLVVWKD